MDAMSGWAHLPEVLSRITSSGTGLRYVSILSVETLVAETLKRFVAEGPGPTPFAERAPSSPGRWRPWIAP